MEWGLAGASAVSVNATYTVVVDVLSFTTTLSVATDAGIDVYPYRWRNASALDHARKHGATLAVGRLEARDSENAAEVSLSPQAVRAASGLRRIVLPSPNGSTISVELAEAGARVLGACLRNHSAVADWLSARFRDSPGSAVAVIAAGERWPDGSLRPAVEDLWGAGSVITVLRERGVTDFSPEAEAAAAAFGAVRPHLADALMTCSSGRELCEAGFSGDVAVAAEVDTSESVPVLVDGRFVDAARHAGQSV
nr:2-phosphosulfolactate phosphatase [Phytoactinopolyspora alkaliphila]